MFRLLYSIFLSLVLTANFANAQNWVWAQRLGNTKSDKVTCIKTDGQGYIYIAGYFSTGTTIGTNAKPLTVTANATSKEAFIAKLDSTGYCYWTHSGGQYFDDRVLGMDVDSAGYATITGTFWEGAGINFSGTIISGSAFGWGDQCFIVRYDPNGNVVWGRFVCSNGGDDQGLDVVMDKHGNTYVCGFMTGGTLYCGGNTVTATNPYTNNDDCFWVTKMDASGTFQWARTFGNLPYDPTAFKYVERDIAICVDDSDGVYITGGFDGNNRKFGTNFYNTYGGHDIFAIKYDSNGNFMWSTHGGSDKDDWSNGICSDKNGNIYITGEHRDSLIIDTIIVKNYDKRDAFVVKLDAATGKPFWGKRAGSNDGGERGNDIWADKNCNVYVCGDINVGAKFGDDITIQNGSGLDAFVARISPNGKWMWVATGGGVDSNDRGNAIAKGLGHQLYTAGFFRSAATYGSTGFSPVGSSDGFFARLHDSMLNMGSLFTLKTPSDTILCEGETTEVKVPDFGYLQVTPMNGVTFDTDTSKIFFNPSSTTTYTISGYSEGLCPVYDTVTFTIYIGEPKIVLPSFTDSLFCAGESVVFNIPPHDFLNISPSQGVQVNGPQDQATFTPSTTTTYTVIAGKNGVCPSSDTVIVTLQVPPAPIAAFSINPEYALIQDPTFHLHNESQHAAYYQWKYLGNTFAYTLDAQRTETKAGYYCYTLVAESLAGCVDSVSHCASIIEDEKVFFPNAFSPNYDNLNDQFAPVLINIDPALIKDFNFIVANRFGQIIYQSSNPYFGWDGNYKSAACEIGTYYYYCTFKTPRGKVITEKGDVSLLR